MHTLALCCGGVCVRLCFVVFVVCCHAVVLTCGFDAGKACACALSTCACGLC